jgi:hypothetical protein
MTPFDEGGIISTGQKIEDRGQKTEWESVIGNQRGSVATLATTDY